MAFLSRLSNTYLVNAEAVSQRMVPASPDLNGQSSGRTVIYRLTSFLYLHFGRLTEGGLTRLTQEKNNFFNKHYPDWT